MNRFTVKWPSYRPQGALQRTPTDSRRGPYRSSNRRCGACQRNYRMESLSKGSCKKKPTSTPAREPGVNARRNGRQPQPPLPDRCPTYFIRFEVCSNRCGCYLLVAQWILACRPVGCVGRISWTGGARGRCVGRKGPDFGGVRKDGNDEFFVSHAGVCPLMKVRRQRDHPRTLGVAGELGDGPNPSSLFRHIPMPESLRPRLGASRPPQHHVISRVSAQLQAHLQLCKQDVF